MSTQEIDFTAGTDSHPNDPHVETPGRVRQVAVPPAARTLSTLAHIDYEDAFLVETGPRPGPDRRAMGPSDLGGRSDHHATRAPLELVRARPPTRFNSV